MTQRRILTAGALTALLSSSLGATAETSEWTLTSVNGSAAVAGGWLVVSEDGAFSGNTGCNGYQGAGRFEDGVFTIDATTATTRMACPGERMTTQDDTVIAVMGGGSVTTTYDPAGQRLFFVSGDERLEFVPRNSENLPNVLTPSLFDVSYVNVFGLTGPLNVRGGPSTEDQVVSRVLPGTLLRSSGCEQGPDRVWCEISFIDASHTTGWAAGEYLQPAPATLRAANEVFDDIGTLPCDDVAQTGPATCDFGVARDGDHSSVIVVYNDDQTQTVLHFAGMDFVYAEGETGLNGGGAEVEVQDSRLSVTLGSDRYSVLRSIITGTAN